MLKILIVDDEYYFRKGFRVILPFEEYGFTICGEARNGAEALDKLAELSPDIAFVDINMPVMDGLDFAAEVKSRGLSTILVLLTGYSEFSYAQKAMQLGVNRYLLKPVNEDELKETLYSLHDSIENTKKYRIEIATLREQAEKSVPILCDRFLNALLRGKLTDSEPEIKLKLAHFQIPLCGQQHGVALLEIDNAYNWQPDESALWRYAIINIVDEMFAYHGISCICREEAEMVCVIFSVHELDEKNDDKVCCLIEEIRTTIQRYLNFTVTVGIGALKDKLSDISVSYEETVFALRHKISLGRNMVITYETVKQVQISGSFYTTERRAELLLNLRMGDIENVVATVYEVFEHVRENNASFSMLTVTCMEIISTCLEYLAEADQSLPELFAPKTDIMSELFQIASFEAMRDWLLELLRSSVQIVRQNHTDRSKSIAASVKRYVEDHYSYSSLTINDIAGSLYMNYGHLCYIFKRETGKTINDYLSEYRMTKAKEMLDSGYTFILDVAEKCGYSDQGYFSKCFKKAYGIAPSKYIANINTE